MIRMLPLFAAVMSLGVAAAAFGEIKSDEEQLLIRAEEIRTEAARPAQSKEGWPLPLAAQWSCGNHPYSQGWRPEMQLAMIEQGHFVLPGFAWPNTNAVLSADEWEQLSNYYEASIKRARQLRLPLVFVGTQWEQALYMEPYLSLPPEKNPNVIGLDGKVLPQVSPFGPVELWGEVGAKYTANPAMRRLQEWYPDPPQVIFISNNECQKLRLPDLEKSKRYLEKYGKGRDGEFQRKLLGDAYITRYRALQEGLRAGLVNASWRKHAMFVGYEACGDCEIGRWDGWADNNLSTAGRIDPGPLMWDGGSPSYYTHDWNGSVDYTTWSPQIEFMNLVFMQKEAYRLNPKFWFEFSTWDGCQKNPPYVSKDEYYRRQGQTYNPQRYGGFVQFGMWLLRPRAVREFRGWLQPAETLMPYYMAIVADVDRVHANPILREFWRKGELVPNRARKHLYQIHKDRFPKEFAAADRWFLLDADVNPTNDPWTLGQPIPVFSLALVQGAAPARRWLVYAHSPLGNRQRVKITIPDYRQVSLDVTVAGSFFLIEEAMNSVKPLKE